MVTAANPHSSNETQVEKEVRHSSPKGDPIDVREFCLNDVRGPVCTTWKVTIPPFSTVHMHANSSVKGHCMWLRVLTVAYNGSTNGSLQRITSGVLQGTYLSAQLEHPFCGNPYKDCGWAGCPCQPVATGNPPNKDFQRI